MIEPLLERYSRQPVLRGLIQLVPFGLGSALDAAVATHLMKIRQDRLRSFFDEVAGGGVKLTPALIESEDFLHCYFSTLRAAVNTRRREKIRMFARLLSSAVDAQHLSSTDEYEEYLGLLDELSYRELLALSTLERYERSHAPVPGENDLQWTNRYWSDFEDEIERAISIPRAEIDPFMTRLTRTGCYQTYTGSFFDFTGGKGKLTSTYFHLMEIVGGIPE